MKMDKARIYVDLNEMVDDDVVLLSQHDTAEDSEGNIVAFYEGMPISIYTDDFSDEGEEDNLIAEGIAIRHDLKKYPGFQHVKWCCRIDMGSLKNISDLKRES